MKTFELYKLKSSALGIRKVSVSTIGRVKNQYGFVNSSILDLYRSTAGLQGCKGIVQTLGK